jgi:hypothetical protein
MSQSMKRRAEKVKAAKATPARKAASRKKPAVTAAAIEERSAASAAAVENGSRSRRARDQAPEKNARVEITDGEHEGQRGVYVGEGAEKGTAHVKFYRGKRRWVHADVPGQAVRVTAAE